MLDDDDVAVLRGRVDDIRNNLDQHEPRLYEVEAAHRDRPDEVVCHFLGGWLIDDALRALVFDQRLTVPCAQLLGVNQLRFWHDQVFFKPAGHPGVVPWHQDYSYWTRTGPARHITVNIMLDDADEENGCVQFVPGSHRWGLLPKLPFDSSLDAIHEHLSAEQSDAFAPVHGCMRAGEATIHHSHTLHGSAGNHSDRPRRALVFNYMAADTRVLEGDEPLLRNTEPLQEGAIIEGEHFPIVLDLSKR
jgi:ectoine hydroxylase-related dioxygenase (phytanoyl-CoA dioxygenase family)